MSEKATETMTAFELREWIEKQHEQRRSGGAEIPGSFADNAAVADTQPVHSRTEEKTEIPALPQKGIDIHFTVQAPIPRYPPKEEK